MRIAFLLLLLAFTAARGQQPLTLFERSGGKQSPAYPEIISWWKTLAARSRMVSLREAGPTDAGFPLHLVLVSADGDTSLSSLKRKGRTIVFVNNGIHPGEPDGIDASMLLVRDIVDKKYPLPANVVLALIPVYNIGGALNRSSAYRVDQQGPAEKGFRGNSQNLDLNRDFIKCDSREALSFTRLFQQLDPDVFVDNHVSNGADYQHIMTLLTTQHNKLGGELGAYLHGTFEPALYRLMKTKGFDLVPYVNHFGETPEKGWSEFWDSPRYSSGYAALWSTFAFVPETHMLKPYAQRVAATRALMESFLEFAGSNGAMLRQLRAAARQREKTQASFPLAWKWNRSKADTITFKGYEAGRKASEVSGLPRLYYDRSKPFTRQVPFYNVYEDTFRVSRPAAYIIPQGWWKVIERLQANGVRFQRLERDTTLTVQWYRIDNYQTAPRPFEGHHLNSGAQVSARQSPVSFRKGDYLILLNQPANRFLIETLEPQGEDSYFAWNFFDPILGQKEGFSDYVFEETAAALLKEQPALRQKLEERRRTDSSFARSARAQLAFIYQQSPYYEPAHLRYPVYRLLP
jgi:hypothetical protein